ncbi:MAG: hypothetical protein J6B87_07730 [Clostridia bacterium]|nr:hypothetical protein [Clostridia bacterium]
MDSMKNVLKNRDGITENEAIDEVNNARESMYDIIENGGSIDDVEDMMICDYGLEMDYIFDLLI